MKIFQKIAKEKRFLNNSKHRGFSLMEMLIYVAIFGVVSVGIMGVVWNVTKIHSKQIASTEVDESLTYVMNLINQKVREASLIDSASSSTLTLIMPDSSNSPTVFSVTDGTLYIQEGVNDAVAITSNRVTVDELNFEQISMAGAKGGVKINITLSYKDEGKADKVFSKNLFSTVSRVSAVTFDSDLLPATNNLYSVGASNPAWKNGYFSGTINATGDITSSGYVHGTTGLCIGADCRTSWSTSGVTGSGTSGYVAKWSSSSALGSSVIYDDGTNIGIGTASPSVKLDVSGSGKISTALIVPKIYPSSNSTTAIQFTKADGSTSVLNIDTTNSRLGIGTTAPGEALEVNGNIKTTADNTLPNIVLDSSSSGDSWTSQGSYISLGESGSLGSAALHLTYIGDGTSYIGTGAVTSGIPAYGYFKFTYNVKNIYTDSTFQSAATGSSYFMGSLGVGTSSPSGVFHAVATSLATRSIFERTTTSTTGAAGAANYLATTTGDMADTFGPGIALSIKDSAGTTNQIGLFGALRDGGDTTGAIYFSAADAGTSVVGLRINKDGKLSVGEDGSYGFTPSAGVHVKMTTEQLRLGYDASNYWSATVGSTGGLALAGTGTGGALTITPTAGQNLNVALSSTGDFVIASSKLYVDTSAGYVGINDSTPSYALDVTGDVNFTGALKEDGVEIFSGMIAMFDTSCPTGWTRFTGLDSKFPRGASSYGGTGGSSSHTHAVGTFAVDIASFSSGQPTYSSNWLAAGSENSTYADHVHTVNPPSTAVTGTSGSTDHTPPYLDMVFCKKNAGADYAEWTKSSEFYDAGIIVSIDENETETMVASQRDYDDKAIGIISEEPGWTVGQEKEGYQMLALNGRVPVFVSSMNGIIKTGDSITTSVVKGFGMKATKPGQIVGKAMEGFDPKVDADKIIDCPDGTENGVVCGKITVFVNISWYGGNGGILSYILGEIKSAFASVGDWTEKTYAKVKELVADNIFAKKVRVERLEMIDQANGDIYCIWIENGQTKSQKGECGSD